MIFFVRSCVINCDIRLIVDQRHQLFGANVWRAGLVFDHLCERFTRHMHTRVNAVTIRLPCLDTALQN